MKYAKYIKEAVFIAVIITLSDRIVDNVLSTRSAKEKMWAIKKSKKARDEATAIVQRHASMKRNR